MMKVGRPKTGKRGKALNLYLPREIVEPAKLYFHKQCGVSLSEGIAGLLRQKLKKEGVVAQR